MQRCLETIKLRDRKLYDSLLGKSGLHEETDDNLYTSDHIQKLIKASEEIQAEDISSLKDMYGKLGIEKYKPTPQAPASTVRGQEQAESIKTKFREQFKAKGIGDEQISGAIALMDARAKSWASEEKGRTPEQWFEKIADVKSGEFQNETPKQYQLPDGRKVMGMNQPEVTNGFYSPLEKVIGETKFDKLPAKQWAEKFANGEEAKWTGLQDWLKQQTGAVSKADIQQFLKDNRIQVVEVVKGEKEQKFTTDSWVEGKENDDFLWETKDGKYKIFQDPDGSYTIYDKNGESVERARNVDALKNTSAFDNETKYEQYQVEGAKENYKEVLITLPQKNPTMSLEKWYEGRIRPISQNTLKPFKELSEAERERTRKEWIRALDDKKSPSFKTGHFDEPNILVHLRMNTRTDAEGNKVLFIEEVQSDWGQKGKKEGFKISEQEQKARNYVPTEGVPQAPFVTETPSWTKLAMKVALKEAVKQGADKIAWTTGEQQNDRYDLSKQADEISYHKINDSRYGIEIKFKGGQTQGVEVKPSELENYVGKELAQKIINDEGKDIGRTYVQNNGTELQQKTFSGLDLKVGGKGMIGFYGSPTEGKLGIVGQVAKSFFKQEPKTVEIPYDALMDTEAKRELARKEGLNPYAQKKVAIQHSIDITTEMKSEVEKGLPLFQKDKEGKPKGAVETLADGRKIIHALDAPDFSTMVHEIAHVFEGDLTVAETKLVKDFGGSEAFSRGFERYLRNGIAPSKEMIPLFQKFRNWLMDIYKSFVGTPIEKRISPEIKKIFDRLLTEKPTTNETIQEGDSGTKPVISKESSQPKKLATEADEGAEPPKEPPKGQVEKEGGDMNELDKLANNIPDSGKVAEYMSKETIEKYTGEPPINDQARGVQELEIALNHGEKIVEKAKEIFGKDYVDKTLDYIENSKAGISNKALMYVSLENALSREKLQALPEKVGELTKQQALVYEQSQKFAREYSLALNYQKLRKIAQVGYDISKITDNFFSAEEIESKQELEKAIEADADTINKEAEKQEAGGMTPEIEKLVSEGVEKEINKIYEGLPKAKREWAEKSLKALDQVQKILRSRTYEATLGIPVAIIDFGITQIKRAIKLGVHIQDAVEYGIKKMKEKLAENKDWKGKTWENEDKFRKDALEEFKRFAPDVKAIVKEALIKNGFGRTINVKGEEKQILDWKKLAGRFGTVSKISENVADVFKKEGKTEAEINRIKDELVKEYIDLRVSVIEKAQNEIVKRNKETVTPEQKSAAKKLAELYTFGLFEQKADEFEVAVNKALGAKVSEQGFKEAKELARAMEIIYANSFKGIRLNDISAKAALERLEDKMRVLLFREAKKQGNNNLRFANLVRNYFEIQQTMLLNNMKQAVENPFSGLQQKIIENINTLADGNTTKALSQQNRKLMNDVYKDMVLKGGMSYGKVESQFVNRQHIDDYVNKLSDNELYHGIASVITGKATLNAMDAMFKAGITEKKFTHNLITILTHPTNANRMNKEDALKFVSEHLTGQSFKDAQKTAKQVIEQINKDAGKELVPTNQEMTDRFANDIVKASLEMGGKITAEQIKAAYGAAYKGAGLGLGHEANNILSATIKGYGARIEGEINNAIKNKEWNRAAALTYKGVLFRNILNPFVGGGTNWLVLKLEKTGLGLFTGLAYKIGSKQDIDLSTKVGLARLEARLYNQGRWKDNIMRGLIGGVVTWGSYALFLALANSDEYEEWRKKNRWAARYLDIFTPEPLLMRMALTDGDQKSVKQYIGQSFNRNDAFSTEAKAVKTLGYAAKGEGDKAWGAFGELIGSKANAPLPWRLFRDNQVLYQGIKGQDPYHGDYKPSSGFFNGYFQGGVIEYLGARPNPQVEPKQQTFKIYEPGATSPRDMTKEETEQYKNKRLEIEKGELNQYKTNIKYIPFDQYGEMSLDESDPPSVKRYDELTPEQIKDLETKIKAGSDDKARAELRFYSKEQIKPE